MENFMEQSRKHLKLSSIVVLVYSGLYLLQLAVEYFFGELKNASLDDAGKIIFWTIALLLFIPQLYIGIKGLKIAKNPTPSKAIYIWTAILLLFAVVSLVSNVVTAMGSGSFKDSTATFFKYIVEVLVYFDHIMYTRAVFKAQ